MGTQTNFQFIGLLLSLCFLGGLLAGYFVRKYFGGKRIREEESRARDVLENARKEAENRKKEV
jgi:hypothetical protein